MRERKQVKNNVLEEFIHLKLNGYHDEINP